MPDPTTSTRRVDRHWRRAQDQIALRDPGSAQRAAKALEACVRAEHAAQAVTR